MTIFEKIIAREIPASIIYEDEQVISFLDINPNNKGHALIVPKQKFVNIFDADEHTIGHMMVVAKRIANVLTAVVGATGVNLVMNNGKDAGQEVFHAHLHVIPRHENDNVYQKPKHTTYADDEERMLAEKIKAAMA
jgi:histidine triad (HIT) family protein